MSDHPAKSDVYPVPNIGSSDRSMRQRRQGIKDWSLPRQGRDPENPAPHYDKDGFAVFASDVERTEWLAKSQDTTRPYIREDKD